MTTRSWHQRFRSALRVPLVVVLLALAPSLAFGWYVEGPITGGTHGWPFGSFAPAFDVTSYGYVEEEFFIAGDALSFVKVGTWTANGAWPVVIASESPFKTRLLVLRPRSPERFNGTVVVEWLNVSSGWDIADVFAHARKELLDHGYAWVGVSTQAVAVAQSPFSLKAWDPLRYAALHHPGDPYAYDIFRQVGEAIREPEDVDILAGLPVRHVIAVGHSQSANGLTTYYNAIQPLEPLYDAFLLFSRTAAALPINSGAGGQVPVPAFIRTDAPTPVIDLQDEWSVAAGGARLIRQADNPAFRWWEVAGSAHVDQDMDAVTGAIVARDLGFPRLVCAAPMDQAPLRYLVHTAIARLDLWVEHGVPPPAMSSSIAFDANGIVKDTYGNAIGGVRLPQLEVPTATYTGQGNSGPGSCPVAGITASFDAWAIAALYPSHGSYVAQFAQAVDALRRSGFLLDYDATDAITHAARSPTGR